jgi:CRP-like cAMP-binding protein
VPRTATAKARQSAVLLALDREQFDNLMLAEPALREKFEGIAALRRQQLQMLH